MIVLTEGFKVTSVAQMRETLVFVGFRALLKGCQQLYTQDSCQMARVKKETKF